MDLKQMDLRQGEPEPRALNQAELEQINLEQADLHMHSTYSSDGTYTPSELMELCAKASLKTVALTDHNSARGVKEAAARAEKLGLKLISGIELDCVCQGVPVHLLGYGIRTEDARLRKVEEEVLAREQAASAERIRLVREAGIVFSEKEVLENAWNGVVTGEMIGEAALKEERNRSHPLMGALYPGGSRSDNPFVNFYWDVCSPGRLAYVPVRYMDFPEAQELIRELGGLSVIAHPGQNIGERPELIRYMREQGVSGIEAYSSYHTPEQARYYEGLAAELGLKLTAGSDFHGKTKPAVRLGRW